MSRQVLVGRRTFFWQRVGLLGGGSMGSGGDLWSGGVSVAAGRGGEIFVAHINDRRQHSPPIGCYCTTIVIP